MKFEIGIAWEYLSSHAQILQSLKFEIQIIEMILTFILCTCTSWPGWEFLAIWHFLAWLVLLGLAWTSWLGWYFLTFLDFLVLLDFLTSLGHLGN